MKTIALLLILSLLLPITAFAKIYKWTDDKGLVHATDDYYNIPEKHRKSAGEPPESPGMKKPVKWSKAGKAYRAFHQALWAERYDEAKSYLSAQYKKDIIKMLGGNNLTQGLKMVRPPLPESVKVTSEKIEGAKALLKVTGRTGEASASGKIKLVRENGKWKVRKVDWEPEPPQGLDPKDHAIPKIPDMPVPAPVH